MCSTGVGKQRALPPGAVGEETRRTGGFLFSNKFETACPRNCNPSPSNTQPRTCNDLLNNEVHRAAFFDDSSMGVDFFLRFLPASLSFVSSNVRGETAAVVSLMVL